MELLTNLLLIVILGALLSFGLVFWLMVRRIRTAFLDFVTPQVEGKPSQLAMAVDAASVMAGRAIVAQVKTTLMGQASGDARAEKAIQGDLALDLADQGGLGGVLSALPNLRRTLRRNPSLIDLALPALQTLMSKGSGAPNNHGSVAGKFRFGG